MKRTTHCEINSTKTKKMPTKKIIVIGAGFGGLSAAALLAREGFEVTLIEKNEGPGGRASTYEEKKFTFDMGPSWYLMPEVFENFFAEFGKKTSDYYELKRLDPAYNIFFGKNDAVTIHADKEKNRQLFAKLEKDGDKKLDKYLAEAEYKYTVAMREFINREYNSPLDMFNKKMMIEGRKLKMLEGLDTYAKRFFKNERARKILEYSIVFLGCSPKNAPAMYSLISHTDFNQGVYYPMEGFGKVAKSFEKIGKQLGVRYLYNTPAEKIIVDNKKAVGVQTKKEIIYADVILVNADYAFSELHLLEKKHRTYDDKYWKSRVIAPSGFIMYLGLNKKIKNLKHHNLFLDNDWMRHFNDIFSRPSWPKNPSYYVSCPSKTDKSVAPKGKENLFFLIPLAPGLEDTPEIRKQFEDMILDHFENAIGESIRKHIITKRVFAHKDFSQRYHAYKGTALGLTHTLMQTAFFRPRHQSKKVKNLYYTGHYCHPGIGVPMTIISSQIVCKKITRENQ